MTIIAPPMPEGYVPITVDTPHGGGRSSDRKWLKVCWFHGAFDVVYGEATWVVTSTVDQLMSSLNRWYSRDENGIFWCATPEGWNPKLSAKTLLSQRQAESLVSGLLGETIGSHSLQLELNDELAIASMHGRLDDMRGLIKRGADVNYRTGTPLGLAVIHGQRDAVKLLISSGADVNAGGRPIKIATHAGSRELIQLLLDADVDVSVLDVHDLATFFALGFTRQDVRSSAHRKLRGYT
jgi:hypothetical protein